MLKITGSLLVIGATTFLGIQKGREFQNVYRELQYIQNLMYLLQSEIRYARTYLGEIFLHLGSKSKEPYKAWLLTLGEKMEKRDGASFEVMWKTGIEEYIAGLHLPVREVESLSSLGAQLGSTDVKMQIQTLDLYQSRLAKTMEEMREGMKEKVRLCHCLGVMSGMFLAVLFL